MARFLFSLAALTVALGCASAQIQPVSKEVTLMGKISRPYYNERNNRGFAMFGLLPDESAQRPLIYCEMHQVRHVALFLLPVVEAAAGRNETVTLHGTLDERGALIVKRAVFKNTAFRQGSFVGLPRWEVEQLNQ